MKQSTWQPCLHKVRLKDFALLEYPHPYGVLPGGNRFLNETGPAATHGQPADLVNDECWIHVLTFCDGSELARIAQTCRYFYIASHQPELWRDLVLRRQEGRTIPKCVHSWKDTFINHYCNEFFPPHQPIAVPGIYSDVFYRLHSCRAFAIPPCWLESSSGNITRCPKEQLSVEVFQKDFEESNTPLLIEGAAVTWKAYKKWQNPEYCLSHSDGRSFRATSGMAPLPANFSLEAYLEYCSFQLLEEAPLYLFDRTALTPNSELWNDYMWELQQTCPFWDPTRRDTGHDLFGILGEGRRPDHTWLIIGPKRSGSVFHIDPNATHAWNAAIVGRKRWIFYPPGVTPPGVLPSDDGDSVALPLSVGEWIFQFWDQHLERMKSAPPGERPLECTAMPGDVIFVPHGWWHLVLNLDELNVAITHNYVGKSNLPTVLKFLDEKRDQVSGCRDREESIKPERLYESFVEALRVAHPDWLERALAEPDWTCRAWSRKVESTEPLQKKHKIMVDAREGNCTKMNVMEMAKSNETSFCFSFL